MSAAIVADPPTPLRAVRPDAPAHLEDVIRQCLDKDPARRPASVLELARLLAPFAGPRGRAAARHLVATNAPPEAATLPAGLTVTEDEAPTGPAALVATDGPSTVTIAEPAAAPRKRRWLPIAASAAAIAATATAGAVIATRAGPTPSVAASTPSEAAPRVADAGAPVEAESRPPPVQGLSVAATHAARPPTPQAPAGSPRAARPAPTRSGGPRSAPSAQPGPPSPALDRNGVPIVE